MRSLSIIVTIIIKAFATFVKPDEECFSGERENSQLLTEWTLR